MTQFTNAQIEAMYFGAGLVLAEFSGRSGAQYRVTVATYSVWHDEGEMLLRIETAESDVICFAIFSIGRSRDGKSRIELGCIQGARRGLDPSITKLATTDFYSTRPKHMLMCILYTLAYAFKVHSVVCVSVRTAMASSNTQFHSRYDVFWEELGGQLDSSGFYVLPFPFYHRAEPRQEGSTHARRHRERAELKAAIYKMLENSLATGLLLIGHLGQAGLAVASL